MPPHATRHHTTSRRQRRGFSGHPAVVLAATTACLWASTLSRSPDALPTGHVEAPARNPTTPGAPKPNTGTHQPAVTWCARRIQSLDDMQGLYRATLTVFPGATHARLRSVRLRLLAPGHPASALLAQEADGQLRLYWKPDTDGSLLWHELVHAGQRGLPAPIRDDLIHRLQALDSRGLIPDEVQAGAFASALVVLRRGVSSDPRDDGYQAYLALAQNINARMNRPRNGAPHGMQQEVQAMQKLLLANPGWTAARTLLETSYGHTTTWQEGLDRLLWLEVHAYWSGDSCAEGHAWWYPPTGAIPPA